ncbi:MAG: EAL domain-containing protein, partial [Acetobacteraceae bacterium]|nr:EAL domain-containing protein [Acetobacteraceae bacterium]
IAYLARYDSLTDLPNRVLFGEALHQACARCRDQEIALLSLDLDEFKSINDSFGHATGDALLIAVAERLRGCMRHGDIAARLGGDEFAIIMAADRAAEVSAFARRVIERLSQPYRLDGRLVEIGASIGATLAPCDGTSPTVLLRNADLALYRAKADGRRTWRFFEPRMDDAVQERRSLQADLRHAVDRNELRLDFQPIIDLATLQVSAAEALVRWQHPQRGMLISSDFIRIAEEAGLIFQIGAWVLREACKQAASWPLPAKVAVNLSPMQFRDPSLAQTVEKALAASRLPASRLELEITESVFLEPSEQTIGSLHRLRNGGVRIALDDFGTGYSSLSYIRSFPLNKIKIDRGFINDLGTGNDASAIVRAIIGLAESMGMVTTAEGVETEEQAAALRSYGCTQGQGFYFSRPIPGEDLVMYMESHRNLSKQDIRSRIARAQAA